MGPRSSADFARVFEPEVRPVFPFLSPFFGRLSPLTPAFSTTVSQKLRILLIGAGGREHALAWKLTQSPRVDQIFVAPGQPRAPFQLHLDSGNPDPSDL